MKPIYLDYNATTPIDPRVAEAMLPFIHQHFGNPSSSHVYGVTTKQAVEKARKQIATTLHAQMEEVIFTSGGSESNNYAKGDRAGLPQEGKSHHHFGGGTSGRTGSLPVFGRARLYGHLSAGGPIRHG